MKVRLVNRVEIVVTIGEIACFNQFILLLHCSQRSSAADGSTSGKGFKTLFIDLNFIKANYI